MWMDFVCIVLMFAHSGGLMIFIRNDICFHVVTRFNIDMSSFRTESMLLKVKINKSWFAIVGIYRPPNIPKVSGNVNLVPFLKMQQQFQMTLFSHHQLERQKKQQQSRSHSYKQQEKNTIIGRAWWLSQWSLPRIQNFKTLRTQISILKSLREKIKSLKAMLSYKICIILLSM